MLLTNCTLFVPFLCVTAFDSTEITGYLLALPAATFISAKEGIRSPTASSRIGPLTPRNSRFAAI